MSRARAACGLLASVSSGLWVLGFVTARRQATFSYLFAFSCVLTTVLGALFLLMIGYASNAAWFVPVRRSCERVVGALPALSLALLPVLLCLRELYPWTDWQALPSPEREHVVERLAWLNVPFFVGRALVYMALFTLFGELFCRWSRQQDAALSAHEARVLRRRLVRLSIGGLVLLSLVLTFAGWDWLMTLDAAWYSNLFGVYLFAGGAVSGLGLIGVLLVWEKARGALPEQVSSHHLHALGRLELALLIFWAYIGWCHVLTQWIANLPAEQAFFVVRWYHGWQWEGLALVLLHFVMPFLALLSRPLKKNPKAFFCVSLWLLAVHALDLHYLVLPALHRTRYVLHWLDFVALVAIASAVGWFASLRGRGARSVPVNDPLLARGLAYESQS